MSRTWTAGKRSSTAGSRIWTAGKPKKKPDYDPESITQELLDAAVGIYDGSLDGEEHRSLRQVARRWKTGGTEN